MTRISIVKLKSLKVMFTIVIFLSTSETQLNTIDKRFEINDKQLNINGTHFNYKIKSLHFTHRIQWWYSFSSGGHL